MADERRLVLSDTSWPGYEEVPSWVIEGYATIFHEVDEQADGGAGRRRVRADRRGRAGRRGGAPPRGPRAARRASSPTAAACMLESARAGRDHGGARAARVDHGRAERGPAVARGVAAGERRRSTCSAPPRTRWRWRARAGSRELGLEAGECSGGAAGAAGRLLADPRRARGARRGAGQLRARAPHRGRDRSGGYAQDQVTEFVLVRLSARVLRADLYGARLALPPALARMQNLRESARPGARRRTSPGRPSLAGLRPRATRSPACGCSWTRLARPGSQWACVQARRRGRQGAL